ncbi:MAG TPA: translocation/assembly module TamB domain-containing protein [Terriglobales bacterium]|nr:translocation/assembly module TamB domain-containing protein [Terriglobales bacterium]
MAKWVGIVVVALIILAGVGVWLVLHNGRIHQYLLQTAERQATAAMGSNVEIGNYSLHISGLAPTFDLYDVVVPGAAPYVNPPLLRVDHLHIGIQITSLLHRAWYLSDLTADHPVIWFYQDAAGRTNIPRFGANASSSNGNTNLFDLAIRHAAINRGEVYANSRPSELQAALQRVRFQSSFAAAGKHYLGNFAYADGRVQFEHYQPLANSLDVDFDATPSGVTISKLDLASGNSRIALNGRVDGYSNPVVHAKYQITLDTAQLGSAFYQQGVRGGVAIDGTLAYDRASSLRADATFNSGALALHQAGVATTVRNINGAVQYGSGNLNLSRFSADALGGVVNATLGIRDLSGAGAATLRLNVRGIRLEQLPRARGVAGTVSADASAHWSGAAAFRQLEANADGTVNAALKRPNAPAIPLRGAIHARFSEPAQQLTLTNTSLASAHSSVVANGTVASRSHLTVAMQSSDLSEVEAIADAAAVTMGSQPPAPMGLGGAGSFNGTVSGTLANPAISGQVAAAPLAVRGTQWRSLSLAVSANPHQAAVSGGQLIAVSGGRIAFNGATELTQWSFTPAMPFHANATVTALPLAEVAKLAGRPLPMTGTLGANLGVSGTELNLAGQGNANVANPHVVTGSMDEPLQTFRAGFRASGDNLQATVNATAPAGAMNLTGSYNFKLATFVAQFRADNLQLARLHTVASRAPTLQGAISLDASGQGTVANPQAQVDLSSAKLAYNGQSINQLRLHAVLAQKVVRASLQTQAVGTTLSGQATVALTGDYQANATLDTQTISLGPLLALYAPSVAGNVSGQTAVHLAVTGPLKRLDLLEAHLQLPLFRLQAGDSVTLAATAPVRLDLTGGVLRLQPTSIQGTDTNVSLSGSYPIRSTVPATLSAVGTVNLKIVSAIDPDYTTGGELRMDVRAAGSPAAPTMAGNFQIVNASLATPSLPVGLENANGVIRLGNGRLDISNFSGTVGGGKVTATGGVSLQPLEFNLAVAARGVRMLYPTTLRETMGADLALTGNMQSALLDGRVRLDDLSVTPQFDLMTFLSQVSTNNTAVAAPGSFSQNVALNIGITTPNQINTSSPDFSLQAGANLTITGTVADPVVLGRVSLNSGDLIYRGDRFVLQPGSLDFIDPNSTEPVVNLSADATIQQYNLHLHFQGPASNLHASYTSDPALPPADIINLLAFGQTTEASAANPAPGNLGAEGLVASAVSSQITDRVQKIAGISQLSIDPVLGGGQQNPGARITIQQRVTGSLFVTVSTDVTSTQRDVIEIQYTVSPRVSLSAVRDQNGGIGLNARFKKVW